MTTTSKTLLVAFAILCGASLLVSQPTGHPQLRIKFTGICDFVPEQGGLHVLLPDLKNEGIRAHRGFIRVRHSDLQPNAPYNLDRTDGTDGALILQGETISLSGSFQPTSLTLDKTYLALVPDMQGLGAVLTPKPGPLAADMHLDKGTLVASVAKSQPRTVFVASKVTPTNCQGARSLANVVELRLPLQQNAGRQSFSISAGPRKLTFDYTSSSDIEVWIGNALDSQIFDCKTHRPQPHGQDTDFLFHYRLAKDGLNSPGVVLPTTCGVTTLMMWEPCYLARWGN